MSKLIDMTGWVMSEHGVPDSRLTVLQRVEDHVTSSGQRSPQWLCECSCCEHKQIVARGANIRNGITKSCGCLQIELGVGIKKHNDVVLKAQA